MFRTMTAGLAMSLGLAGSALAAGPMGVTTNFPAPLFAGDPFHDNLLSIGVGVELASPTFVDVFSGADLTFRLLQAFGPREAPVQITELVVDGVGYDIAPQAFSAAGTLLGTQFLQGSFNDLVGFLDADMEADPGNPPPLLWPTGIQVYIRSVDEANLSGIGPFIGDFDTLYFSIGGAALFEVSAAAVPEPGAWALMILGFGLGGTALRRARREGKLLAS
jgi:hypothetical protein